MHWLRVFRSTEAARMGSGVGQQRLRECGQNNACGPVAECGTGRRVMAGFFGPCTPCLWRALASTRSFSGALLTGPRRVTTPWRKEKCSHFETVCQYERGESAPQRVRPHLGDTQEGAVYDACSSCLRSTISSNSASISSANSSSAIGNISPSSSAM